MSSSKAKLQREQVAMAFGTPISSMLWPDSGKLNGELRQVILAREKADAGVKRSNVGGWHSAPDLLDWKHDCIAAMRDRIVSNVGEMTQLINPAALQEATLALDCWANVSRRGDYNSVHDHPASTWSGIYYVACGRLDNADQYNGKLELFDPRVGINMSRSDVALYAGRYLVEPKPGLMVIFPSWLKHMVHPYYGDDERIGISFNALVARKA